MGVRYSAKPEMWKRGLPPGLRIGLSSVLLALAAPAAEGQLLYRADAKTVSSDGGSSSLSPVATRLYLDEDFGLPVPINTTIWFVADKNHDGVLALHQLGRLVPIDEFLGADDVILCKDVVSGDQPPGPVSANEGRYRRLGMGIYGAPAEQNVLANADIYLILWKGIGAEFVPGAGTSFGLQNVGIRPPSDFGNAFWAITENISSDQYILASVPEPASGQVAAASLLLASTLAVRLSQAKKRD